MCVGMWYLRFENVDDLFEHFWFEGHHAQQLHRIEISKHTPLDIEIFQVFGSLALPLIQHVLQSVVYEWGDLPWLHVGFWFVGVPISVSMCDVYLDFTSDSVRKSWAFFISNSREPYIPYLVLTTFWDLCNYLLYDDTTNVSLLEQVQTFREQGDLLKVVVRVLHNLMLEELVLLLDLVNLHHNSLIFRWELLRHQGIGLLDIILSR